MMRRRGMQPRRIEPSVALCRDQQLDRERYIPIKLAHLTTGRATSQAALDAYRRAVHF